ncbi:MAG: ATP-binding protein [Spirochaetaceae bacterium]|jgi:predicted AAA+ superfamily ATPase|nr:ATP-binding protein [Spirochaetaceae bacterium]
MNEKDCYFDRKLYTEQLQGFINKPVIKVITGIRRCGKSALLELFQKDILHYTDKKHIISINFEDTQFDTLTNYTELDGYIRSLMTDDNRYYIFLDEIQAVEQWERCVNSLRLKNTDIYITGSNSDLLSSELATLLSGRYVEFCLHTLSFSEFIDFRKKSGLGSDRIDDELEAYIKTGGFPILSTTELTPYSARKIVIDIQNSVVLRDVIERNNIRNVQLLQKIIAFMYDNIGNITSVKKISDFLKSQKRTADFETVYNYLHYLENALIIYKAPRYDVKGKKLLESYEKYYLADHSLQYTVREFNLSNISGILENIVYMELRRRGYTVSVGRIGGDKSGEREIDFIAENPKGKVYIQVCYLLASEETIEREFAPLLEIRDNYPKLIVTMDRFWQIEKEGVKGIHLADFLLSGTPLL